MGKADQWKIYWHTAHKNPFGNNKTPGIMLTKKDQPMTRIIRLD